jgi:hypothetical protein
MYRKTRAPRINPNPDAAFRAAVGESPAMSNPASSSARLTCSSEVPLASVEEDRPTKTPRELLVEIIARVALGGTLTKICAEEGMPSPSAFRVAVAKDAQLGALWLEAKEERPHALFEEAIDMGRQLRETRWTKDDTNKVRALQVAIDALRTAAARLKPREYGERPATSVVVPVQIVTSLGLEPGVLPPKEVNQYTYDIQVTDGRSNDT